MKDKPSVHGSTAKDSVLEASHAACVAIAVVLMMIVALVGGARTASVTNDGIFVSRGVALERFHLDILN